MVNGMMMADCYEVQMKILFINIRKILKNKINILNEQTFIQV